MKAKRRVGLLGILLLIALLTACGACKHNYQERDGRVVCLECKEVCNHTYQIDGTDAYCTNCLFSCKHSFAKRGEDMACSTCGIVCNHIYENNAGVVKCKYCGLVCDHEYLEANGKRICQKCGAEKVVLTKNNVNDFFTVNAKIYDISVRENYAGTKDMGRANADVTISSKKGANYNNVVLTILLETSSGGWLNQSREVAVDFNGNGERSFNFSSGLETFVSKNPSFKAKIIGVTGEIAD